MEWFWFVIVTGTILFLFFVAYRVVYRKGYKAGARRVLFEWKQTLNEEEENNELL